MKNIIPLLIVLFLISSCSKTKKKVIEQKIETSKKTIDSITKPKEEVCLCFNGIGSIKGDQPIKKIKFSNGKEVSICGYYEPEEQSDTKLYLSEFDIFDCESQNSYATYGAVDNCSITIRRDSIIINSIDYITVIKNEKWSRLGVITGKQIISISSDSLVASPIIPYYKSRGYKGKIANNFHKNLDTLKNYGPHNNWDKNISKLEFLALEGSVKALRKLKNYGEFTNYTPSGAYAEQLQEAIDNVEWIKSKEIEDCVFDSNTQTDEFLNKIPEFENYTWYPSKTTAKLKYEKDSLEIYKGGCAHFSVGVKMKIPKDSVNYNSWKNIISKILPVTELLKDDFAYENILKAIENKEYKIDSIYGSGQAMFFQNEYLSMNNYSIYQESNTNHDIIELSWYMN
jgi:hypothetical protein